MITCSCHGTNARGPRLESAGSDVLCALNNGPRTLGEIAHGVYGADTLHNRRKVTWVLKQYREHVRRVAPSTWEIAR